MRPPAEVGLGAGWASLGLGFARVGWGVEHYPGFVDTLSVKTRCFPIESGIVLK